MPVLFLVAGEGRTDDKPRAIEGCSNCRGAKEENERQKIVAKFAVVQLLKIINLKDLWFFYYILTNKLSISHDFTAKLMNMKNLLFCLLTVLILFSCSSSKRELYQKTDEFVTSLHTTYESYGLQGQKYSTTTKDGLYTITPIGRLINVKIQKVVDDEVYEKLRKDLEKHYHKDSRVNKVYINQGGTIMIDCRN